MNNKLNEFRKLNDSSEVDTTKGYTVHSSTTGGGPKPQNDTQNLATTHESDNYTMESQIFDYEKVKKSENFAVKIFSKAIYKGQLDSNKRHGKGAMVYQSGRVYEGSWEKDK
jgi:hypothetical protein